MKKIWHKTIAKVRGKNLNSTPRAVIVDQMNEPRPLPMGRADFHEWAVRIISGALIPGGEDNPEAHIEGQKFALADCLTHLGPTESHKPDAYFIHVLRKFAINQVAITMRRELHEAAKARIPKAADEVEQG